MARSRFPSAEHNIPASAVRVTRRCSVRNTPRSDVEVRPNLVLEVPLDGTSMNPARSIAPDLVRGAFATTWIYVTGPLLGAIIAVGFEWILKGPATREGTRTAQGASDEN
jgi:hypothetical protein